MNEIFIQATIGGLLIGLSATMMLWLHGRIAGISGIVYGLIDRPKGDTLWRVYFIVGLMLGGFLMSQLLPGAIVPREGFPSVLLLIAGFIVGVGTRIGGGCTSGHGVCGIARFSVRSIVATLIFIGVAMATSFVLRHLLS